MAADASLDIVAVAAKQNVALASYDEKDVVELLNGLNLIDKKWTETIAFKAFQKQDILEVVNVHRVLPIHYKAK